VAPGIAVYTKSFTGLSISQARKNLARVSFLVFYTSLWTGHLVVSQALTQREGTRECFLYTHAWIGGDRITKALLDT
jgi:hypothetical protein